MEAQELKILVSAVRKEVRRALSVWMTDSEARDYLKISKDKLRAIRAQLKPRLCGKQWRYSRASLDAYLTNPWVK